MIRKSKPLAWLLAIVLVFAMLFSVFYLVETAEHECTQDNCPICQQIELCENTLHSLAFAAAASLGPCLYAEDRKDLRPFCHLEISFPTLVSLKIKLSN